MTREKITTEHIPSSWNKEVDKFVKGESFDAYARYMYPEQEKKEKDFAKMMEVPDTAIFNSGMAAIATAIEAEELKPGDVILAGREVYGETKKIYDSLDRQGIKVIKIDSGNMEEVENLIKKEKPRLIILESVTNDPGNPEMQVCDVKKLIKLSKDANIIYQNELTPENQIEKYFLSKAKGGEHGTYEDVPDELKGKIITKINEFKEGNNPFVFRNIVKDIEKNTGMSTHDAVREVARIAKYVLKNSREKLSLIVDNTLPSPNLYNPTKEGGDSDVEMVVVESATKHYQKGGDKITMGIAYSSNAGKIKAIKDKRMALGTYLQPTSEKEIPEDIIEVMPGIMKQHAKNAKGLAELLDQTGIDVSHPNLPRHKQSELVKKIAPEGLVTLFYVKVPNASKFVEKVYTLGQGKISVGGSFGHKKTWLMNLGDETVRIAAGSENDKDFQKVMDAFEKVAKEL